MPKTFPRVLVVSHGHPSFSLGGAEIAAYNLHKGLNRIDGAESRFLARVGYPVVRHSGTALMSLRQNGGDILYHADEYDHFLISNRNTEELERDFLRVLRDLKPDVVHFHHFIGLGLETVYAVRRALPDCVIVITFHEFLSHLPPSRADGEDRRHQALPAGIAGGLQQLLPGDLPGTVPAPGAFRTRIAGGRGLLRLAEPVSRRSLCRLGIGSVAVHRDRERSRYRGADSSPGPADEEGPSVSVRLFRPDHPVQGCRRAPRCGGTDSRRHLGRRRAADDLRRQPGAAAHIVSGEDREARRSARETASASTAPIRTARCRG